MKKVLILCILAIGMMANAQTNNVISKKLQLQNVPVGTANDSVLVWGANKVVKHRKLSDLFQSSGGSDLASALSLGYSTSHTLADGFSSGYTLAPDYFRYAIYDNNYSRFSGLLIDKDQFAITGSYLNPNDTLSKTSASIYSAFDGVSINSEQRNLFVNIENRISLKVDPVKGLGIKTSNYGNGFYFKSDNLQGDERTLQAPDKSGTIALIDDIPAPKYTTFNALITQYDTDDPILTLLPGEILNVSIIRVGVGTYWLMSNSDFVLDKTTVFLNNTTAFTNKIEHLDINIIVLKTFDASGALVDSALNKSSLEVKVYLAGPREVAVGPNASGYDSCSLEPSNIVYFVGNGLGINSGDAVFQNSQGTIPLPDGAYSLNQYSEYMTVVSGIAYLQSCGR